MSEDEHRERVEAIRREIREARAELRATLDRRIERRMQGEEGFIAREAIRKITSEMDDQLGRIVDE